MKRKAIDLFLSKYAVSAMPFDEDDILPQAQKSEGQRRIALVIGNGAYAHASPLANPSNDAKAICEKLEALGFTVFRGFDLGYQQLGKQVVEFEQAIKGADVTLLFYAGHGLQVHGKNYLVPVDAKIDGVAELKFSTILFDDILEPMTRLSKAALVFLDACRDNPFARNVARSLGQRSVSGGLAKIEAASGSFISFATAPDQVAYDGHGENSPFTSAFLRHVDTPGLSLSDVMIDVRNSVLEETNGKQEPWDQSSLRSRFYFVPEEPKPATPQIPAELAEAQAAWKDIEHSANIGNLTAFKNRYAGTVYADYAENRINELRTADEKAKAAKEAQRRAEEDEHRAEEQVTEQQRLARERQAAEARAQDDSAFAKALKEDTVAAYKTYMSAYRQGAHIADANAAIRRLKPFPIKALLAGVSVLALITGGVVVYRNWTETPEISRQEAKAIAPETVLIPGGTFQMGCVSGKDCSDDEKPVHRVTVGSFYMSKYETTFAEYDACVKDGGCKHKPGDEGWGAANVR